MKSKKYLKFVASLPCCQCGTDEVHAHHLIGVGEGCMGGKASDLQTLPVCHVHHSQIHQDPKNWPQERWIRETLEQAIGAGILVVK